MTDNLTVSRGVFLGSSGTDTAVGVAINSDNIIMVAGNDNGSGKLYRLSPQSGSSPLSVTDLGGTVSDLALVQGTTVGQQDRVVVVGSFGVKVYDPTGSTVIWQQLGNFQEVAVATNGTVITLAADKTLSLDNYTNFSNTGAGSFTFYAQINPNNGDVIKGQYLLTRLSAGGGNSYTPGAITVDGEGNVYVGGTAAASLPDRSNQQINGNPVAGYSGGDVALFSASIDLGTRNFWTPFTTNSGTSGSNGSVVGVAAGEGFQVLLATAKHPGALFAENGATPLGGDDIYLAVVDITNPSVIQLTPADNLTDVPLASDLKIQFTEGVQLGTGSVTIQPRL